MPKKKSIKEPKLREAKAVETPDEQAHDETWADDDSLMVPMEGESITEDEATETRADEQEQQEQAEDETMFGGNEALIEAVMDWLKNEEEGFDSIAAAMHIAKEYEISKDAALVVMDTCSKLFKMKRVQFENIRDKINSRD